MTPEFTDRWITYRFTGATSNRRTREVLLQPQPEPNHIFIYYRFSQQEFARLMIAANPEMQPLFVPEHGAHHSHAGAA